MTGTRPYATVGTDDLSDGNETGTRPYATVGIDDLSDGHETGTRPYATVGGFVARWDLLWYISLVDCLVGYLLRNEEVTSKGTL